MNEGGFSPLTIKALADAISGGGAYDQGEPVGIYRSAPKMEALLLDCNLDFRIGSNSRVSALVNFLRYINQQPDGFEAIGRVIVRVADPREYLQNPEKGLAVINYLNAALVGDGYELILHEGLPTLRRRGSTAIVVDTFSAKASTLNFDTVRRDVDRALRSADSDPEDAVTAACSLIESVCRSILLELSLPLPDKRDIDGLMKAVQEPLRLSPARSDLPAEVAADIKQILGGLTSVAKGIGALRTHAGDAHGRERGFTRIDSRIARLSIHSASTIALFLIETWEKNTGRALPDRTAS